LKSARASNRHRVERIVSGGLLEQHQSYPHERVGIVFAAVYAATGNIFIAVGADALGNAPTLLVAPGSVPPTLVHLATLLLMSSVWAVQRRSTQPDSRSG
jgi:hypothetical protein